MRLGCFSSPREVSRDISGVTCTASKLPWSVSLQVAQRLIQDVGEFAAKIFASPDDELPEEVELILRAVAVNSLGVSEGKAADMTARVLRMMLSVQFLSQVKTLDLPWYVDRLIVGSMVIGGRRIDTREDLDAAGCGVREILQLLALSLEANLNPTSAGDATSDGNVAPAPTPTATTRGKSNVQSVREPVGQ